MFRKYFEQLFGTKPKPQKSKLAKVPHTIRNHHMVQIQKKNTYMWIFVLQWTIAAPRSVCPLVGTTPYIVRRDQSFAPMAKHPRVSSWQVDRGAPRRWAARRRVKYRPLVPKATENHKILVWLLAFKLKNKYFAFWWCSSTSVWLGCSRSWFLRNFDIRLPVMATAFICFETLL